MKHSTCGIHSLWLIKCVYRKVFWEIYANSNGGYLCDSKELIERAFSFYTTAGPRITLFCSMLFHYVDEKK